MARFANSVSAFLSQFSETGLHADQLREKNEQTAVELHRAGENHAQFVHNTFSGTHTPGKNGNGRFRPQIKADKNMLAGQTLFGSGRFFVVILRAVSARFAPQAARKFASTLPALKNTYGSYSLCVLLHQT